MLAKGLGKAEPMVTAAAAAAAVATQTTASNGSQRIINGNSHSSNRATMLAISQQQRVAVATATMVTQVPTTGLSIDISLTTGATPTTNHSVTTGASRHPQTTAAAAAATEAATTRIPNLTAGIAMNLTAAHQMCGVARTADHLTGVHQNHLHRKCAAMIPDHHDVKTFCQMPSTPSSLNR